MSTSQSLLGSATTRRWAIRIELIDDLVLSSRQATSGDHEGLDRIPGGTLRGWCAAALYEAMPTHAWTLFHSGQVRFLDGLPADTLGHRSLPVPLSWHVNKLDPKAKPHANGQWQAQLLYNLAAQGDGRFPQEGAQPKSQRQGYVGATGEALLPQRHYRLMTAIGEQGQVADGQLFGYESLRSGQHFVACLEVDDGALPEDALQQVLARLSGLARLGRSRSAHYGRVQLGVEALPSKGAPQNVGQELHLLLVSDACLRNAYGLPTLNPLPEHLGLPAGTELLASRSFVRTRRVSGWNAYRNGPTLELQLLKAGSVLSYANPEGFSADVLARLASGVGGERALGYGELAVHPSLLQDPQPRFGAPSASARPASPTQPNTALIRALVARSGRSHHGRSVDDLVQPALRELAQRWLAVRRYLALVPQREHGPGNSQWGALAQAAQQVSSVAALQRALLGDEGGLICRRKGVDNKPYTDEQWADSVPLSQDRTGSLATWVQETLAHWQAMDPPCSDALLLDAWQRLCHEARKSQLHSSEAALQRLLGTAATETLA